MIQVIPGEFVPKKTAKVAVSLPGALYQAVEKARRRTGKARSTVVQEALRDWLRREAQAELVREYQAGYRARPEDASEIDAALATATGLLRADTITTIPKRALTRRLTALGPARRVAVDRALRFALGLV